MNKVKIHIRFGFVFVLAIAIIIFPIKVIFAWLLAAAFHEIGHILSLSIMGKGIENISLGFSGASIQTEPMTYKQEILAAASGPVFGSVLILFSDYIPMISIFAFINTVINLIPLYPMDGGRVLRGLIYIIFKETVARKICNITFYMQYVMLLIGGVFVSLKFSTYWILIATIFFMIKIKLSCKQQWQEIQ